MVKRVAAKKRLAKAKPAKPAKVKKAKKAAKAPAGNPEWIEDEFKNPYNY